jgi:hypothetical protein
MKVLKSLFLVGLLMSFFAVSAFAEYNPAGDKYVDVNTGAGVSIPTNSGEITYDATQAVHTNISEATGTDIEYSYIFVTVDGQRIAAIDPPAYGY